MKLNLRKGTFKAEWRAVKGYEGLYEVSNLGQVRSLDRHFKYKTGRLQYKKGKILKRSYDKDNYRTVGLYKNCKSKTYMVHRLVAKAFIPNTENKPHIDHINTDKNNNKVFNLRWVTSKENINNPLTLEKHKGKKHSEKTKNKMSNSCKTKKKVLCIETNVIYNSIREYSKAMNVERSSISAVCKGKYKQIKGYHFKYID